VNITLRKAKDLRDSLWTAINDMTFVTQFEMTEFQMPVNAVAQVEETFAKNLINRDALLLAMYELEKHIEKGYMMSEIGNMMSDIDLLKIQIEFFEQLISRPVMDDMTTITGKLDKIRKSTTADFSTVTVNVLTKEDITGFTSVIAQSKRSKQHLEDQILEMSLRTELEVSEQAINTLKENGII
jgi:hypothetical protein|tara:strand:+ start:64 stop:615 length:552 start_codon:yes stop_codon:yes gene_type:complete